MDCAQTFTFGTPRSSHDRIEEEREFLKLRNHHRLCQEARYNLQFLLTKLLLQKFESFPQGTNNTTMKFFSLAAFCLSACWPVAIDAQQVSLGDVASPTANHLNGAVPPNTASLSTLPASLRRKLQATIPQLGQSLNGDAADDEFGYSVSMSKDGKTVAVGAFGNDANGSNSGLVRVFTFFGATWIQLGSDILGEAAGDWFGISVSLSYDGRTLAIGAPGNESEVGHTRVYRWNGSTWQQLGPDIDGEATGDNSGHSVSIAVHPFSGTTVAIGAPLAIVQTGRVKVYNYDEVSNDWVQIGADIDGEAADDYSGWSVSLCSDGCIVAIGAPRNDGNGSDAGHVRVYKLNKNTKDWQQIGADIDGEAVNDYSGGTVALSGDGYTVAIGAIGNDGNGGSSGHVRLYRWSHFNSIWTLLGSDFDGEAAGDQSGSSVSLCHDGSLVAIGAPHNDGNGSNAGHVRLYKLGTSGWNQIGADIDGHAASESFGGSVSLSADGTTLAVGAPFSNANGSASGQVRVFDLPPEAYCVTTTAVRPMTSKHTTSLIASCLTITSFFLLRHCTSHITHISQCGDPHCEYPSTCIHSRSTSSFDTFGT